MTIPLPIPQHFTLQYFYLPYLVKTKIYQGDIFVKMNDSLMNVKQRISQQASEFYKKKITPYEFVIAQIDKQDFTIAQLFQDDESSSVMNINLRDNYIFAYEIHSGALNEDIKAFISSLDVKFNQDDQPQKSSQDHKEETKEDVNMEDEPPLEQLPVKLLHEIINPNWIKVPLLTAVRATKQHNSYSYMGNSKYMTKEYIPRLLWLNQDWNLRRVHQHVFIQYAHMLDIEQEEVSTQYEEIFGKLDQEDNLDNLDVDHTSFKLALYVNNPYKGKYYGPNCRVCGKKSCNGCPLPVIYEQTLSEFLDKVAHKTKFKGNDNLFINTEQLKEQEDSDEENKTNNNKLGFWYNSPDSADKDDEVMQNDQEKESNAGRHKLFQLQLLFVNRLIKKPIDFYNSVLMSFDHHPRQKHS